MVIATINGAVVSWINKYDGGAAATTATTAAASATTLVTTTAAAKTTKAPKAELSIAPPPPSSPSATAASAPSPSPAPVASGAWGQTAYYNAESGAANGLVFLNHMGGQGSGVFD